MARSIYFKLYIAQNVLFLLIHAQNNQKECLKEISQLHKPFFDSKSSSDPNASKPKPAICDHCCCDDLNYDTVSCQYLYGDNFIKSAEILKQDGLQEGFNRFYYENMFQTDLPDINGESSIQEYWARKNQIETLDFNKLTNFKNLKMLVVMHNRLNSTISSQQKLESIEVVEMGQNFFIHITNQTFISLSGAQNISLDNNRIQRIENDAFSHCPNLVELILRGNHIRSEALPNLQGISKLVKLDLSNNFLQHLSKAYFKNMPDLQILRLHGNKINYLTQMAFYKMEKLTQIDLSNNWLTYVDPYIFTDLSTPEWTVDVTTNPFICDCGIEGFVRWMTKNTKHLRHYDKIQCMSGGQELGQKNFGKLLSQITGESFCESDLTTIILIPCVILGALILISCCVCVKRKFFSETKEMEEFERNEAARRAAEDADSLGEDSQGNQVGLPVSLMPNVNPDLMADRPEVMAAVRTQQLVSSGMDPLHARIAAQRGARDVRDATGYSSSAYGSEDEKPRQGRRDLNAERSDLQDADDVDYKQGPRGSAF